MHALHRGFFAEVRETIELSLGHIVKLKAHKELQLPPCKCRAFLLMFSPHYLFFFLQQSILSKQALKSTSSNSSYMYVGV